LMFVVQALDAIRLAREEEGVDGNTGTDRSLGSGIEVRVVAGDRGGRDRDAVPETLVTTFYEWWDGFCDFIVLFFRIEEKYLFTLLASEASLPMGLQKTSRNTLRVEALQTIKVIDNMRLKTDGPFSTKLPALKSKVHSFAQTIITYLRMKESVMVNIVARSIDEKLRIKTDCKIVADILEQSKGDRHLMLYIRGMSKERTKTWQAARIAFRNRFSQKGWQKTFEDKHLSLVNRIDVYAQKLDLEVHRENHKQFIRELFEEVMNATSNGDYFMTTHQLPRSDSGNSIMTDSTVHSSVSRLTISSTIKRNDDW